LSVINQTYKNWELILIDDGSTDDSVAVASEFSDTRISLIVDGKNLGLISRLNQLIKLAQGVFIARMDSDDIMVDHRIETQLRVFRNKPHLDAVGSSYYVIDSDNSIFGVKNDSKILKTSVDVLVKGGLAHPTVLARTSWFRENLYNPIFLRCEDFELWMRTVDKSEFVILENHLLFYRSLGTPTIKKYLQTNFCLIKVLVSSYGLRISKLMVGKEVLKISLKLLLYRLYRLPSKGTIF